MNTKNLITTWIILGFIISFNYGYSQQINWEQDEGLKKDVYDLVQDFCTGSEGVVKENEISLSKLFVYPNGEAMYHFLSIDPDESRLNVKEYEKYIKTNYPKGFSLGFSQQPEILIHIQQSDSTLIEAKVLLHEGSRNKNSSPTTDTLFFMVQYKRSKGELKDFKIQEINDHPVLFENSLKSFTDEKAIMNTRALMKDYSKFGTLSHEDQIQPYYIESFKGLFYQPDDSTQVVNYLDFEETTPNQITLPEYIHFISDWYLYKSSQLNISELSEVFPLVEYKKQEYIGQVKANVAFSGLYKSKFRHYKDEVIYFLLHYDKNFNPQIIAIATDAFYLNPTDDVLQKQRGEIVLDFVATPAITGFALKGGENYKAQFTNFESIYQFGGKVGLEVSYYFRSKKADSANIEHCWGIGLGVYYTVINGLIECNKYSDSFSQIYDSTLIDKDGDPFTKMVYGNNIQHQVNITNIEIPILIKYRHKRPKINYYANLGVSFSYNIYKDFSSSGEYEYQGSYDLVDDEGIRYIFTLLNLPEYGYDNYQAQSGEEMTTTEMNFSLVGAAGVEIPISKSFSFRFGPSIIYNITNLLGDSDIPERLTIQEGINESLIFKNKMANYYLFGFDLGFTIEL